MFQPPVSVSPLIKFARWSLLSLGIFYGAFNQKRLSKKETQLRLVDAKQKEGRNAKLAEEKKRLAQAEMHAFDILSGKID